LFKIFLKHGEIKYILKIHYIINNIIFDFSIYLKYFELDLLSKLCTKIKSKIFGDEWSSLKRLKYRSILKKKHQITILLSVQWYGLAAHSMGSRALLPIEWATKCYIW
jgi:hypothetical protein